MEAPGSTKTVAYAFGDVQHPTTRVIGRARARNVSVWLETGDIVVGTKPCMTVDFPSFCYQPNSVRVLPGGLDGTVSGLEKLKNTLVSGKKLVIRLGETACTSWMTNFGDQI